MTSPPADWHPDPLPQEPGQPPQLRYWDGARWTDHTAPATQPAYPAAYSANQPRTTPDGVPLASWGQRLAATLLDALVTAPITLVLFIPFYPRLFDVYGDYFDEVRKAADNGTAQPSAFDVQTQLFGTFALMGLTGLVFSLVWVFGWLRWKQATPGKLWMGLRVRRRDEPGPLPWGTIAKRWLAQYGTGVLGLIPFIGSIGGIYNLLDGLWPLWDDKNQALHDKFAGTNVVKTR